MKTHTHTGYSRTVGQVHAARLYGHSDYRGKIHALNGSDSIYTGGIYTALCGATVRAEHDGYLFNVCPAKDVPAITCKRCRKISCSPTIQTTERQ